MCRWGGRNSPMSPLALYACKDVIQQQVSDKAWRRRVYAPSVRTFLYAT